jgi:hypothetical protein
MTVAFVVAKAQVSAGDASVLDPYVVVPFPGDPTSDNYEDTIPDVPNPFIFVIGQVTRINSSNPMWPIVNIVATEYIQDQFVQTNLQFVAPLSCHVVAPDEPLRADAFWIRPESAG